MLKNILTITFALTTAALLSACVEDNYHSNTQYQQNQSTHRYNRYDAPPPSTTTEYYSDSQAPVKGYQSSTNAPPSSYSSSTN